MSDTPRTDSAIRNSGGQWSYVLRDTCEQLERELADALTAIAMLGDRHERELADKRSQINRLIVVIKSRNADKVYADKKWNELRDEVMATREQRDSLTEALREIASGVYCWKTCVDVIAPKALAATKGGSHATL